MDETSGLARRIWAVMKSIGSADALPAAYRPALLSRTTPRQYRINGLEAGALDRLLNHRIVIDESDRFDPAIGAAAGENQSELG